MMRKQSFYGIAIVLTTAAFIYTPVSKAQKVRERVSINEGWLFFKGDPLNAAGLSYDVRPVVQDRNDNVVADSKPTEAISVMAADTVLKKWILPTANDFIADSNKHHSRPVSNPGGNVLFTQNNFNDHNWERINLPHDWAIKGPFYKGANAIVGGGMGRLPIEGIGWYRKKISINKNDQGKNIYLEIDGAMSYAAVWMNGSLIGGWPYGYNSFRLNLTPYLNYGGENLIAIRVDNPNHSARWYPGAGIYRNVWLTKVNPVQVAHWGTFISSKNISTQSANIELETTVANQSGTTQQLKITTDIYLYNAAKNKRSSKKSVSFSPVNISLLAGSNNKIQQSQNINNPKLWGPMPNQTPHLYVAVTCIYSNGKLVDEYETKFGIRSLVFDGVKGLLVNGERVKIQGVNQHHDLGALGAAFNVRAAERQLEILREMGCNAIRMAHNPPAPELLDLTDKMGFLVIDEIFDSWERKKTPLDFHLIFKDWHEADTRSFVRRDRNHPSIIAWSYGNEVGEQYTDVAGAAISKRLYDIVKEEDPTRPATASMNYAKPNMPFAEVMDIIGLNYQGEGIRDAPAYAHLTGIRTSPLYPGFHQQFPDKLIVSSETASALSTRGSYIFPVTRGMSAPVSDSTGGDPINKFVSAYELYTAQFGASPDKVFATQDKHPYVAGEFVWTGWDYLGEPTPYYDARSSYCGIIDLAGFKKDRFYLYQSRWRPTLPVLHILPHWNWPNRIGQQTPVHIFTSGDEVELFLNGRSLGRKKKGDNEYRLRWDDVIYEPGTLSATAYKNGQKLTSETVRTTGEANQIKMVADRRIIKADGNDLSFITVDVVDDLGRLVPDANQHVSFSIEGPGEIVATDNGDPANLESFAATSRDAYFGKVLVVVRSEKNKKGTIILKASASSLKEDVVKIKTK